MAIASSGKHIQKHKERKLEAEYREIRHKPNLTNIVFDARANARSSAAPAIPAAAASNPGDLYSKNQVDEAVAAAFAKFGRKSYRGRSPRRGRSFASMSKGCG